MISRFLLCCLVAIGARCMADQPGILGPAIFTAQGGDTFARVNYRDADEVGKQEAYGTVFRLNRDGSEEALWHFSGIRTFHPIEVFLCSDMAHMAVVLPVVSGQEAKIEDYGIAFYDRGRLLKRYSPSELVLDSERIVRSTSSYAWLARNPWTLADRPSNMELGFWLARSFWLRTIDGTLYEFDSYTGGILKKEPNQAAQPTRGKAPRG